MTQSQVFSPYDAAALPPVVAHYLSAQDDANDRASLKTAFGPRATVTDEGITHEGHDAIGRWLTAAASEYSYTTTFIGQRSTGTDQWAVLVRLDGNFPGGTAELAFRFRVVNDTIEELVIAP